ncbi:MAG: helix-turn-helix transcriptional regulator [Anaerolineae bacterium]
MVQRTKVLDVRSKMIGVLLRAARLKARKSLRECAEWLSCSPHIMSQYEHGRRGISLPELELLASFFDVPVSHLWDEEPAVLEQATQRPAVEKLIPLRQKEIGVLLRQARAKSGKTQKQCGDLLGVSAEIISKYEYGTKPTPFPHLELLASYLEVSLADFLDRELLTSRMSISRTGTEVLPAKDTTTKLSRQIEEFVRNPESLPYLEMALRLYELPKDSLRHLAEAMLSAEGQRKRET